MHGLNDRLKRLFSQRGFSLVELMVGGLVLVVGLVALAQFFASAASRVLESDIRSVLHQVAAQEMENIRGLPYTDVGVPGGIPDGVLIPIETRTVDIVRVQIQRTVIFWTDPSYEEGGPYPGNYRRVTVTVSAVDQEDNVRSGIEPVELVSNVAGGATGGTLLVRVQDSEGLPVEGASFTIVNDTLVPNVNFNSPALVTNELGIMLVPGLKVDATGGYVVEATKTGYSTDSKTGFVVLEGATQEVILTIDELSAMVIRVVDSGTGADVAGLNLTITGPQSYAGTLVSAAGGVTVNDLRFSDTADPYIVTIPAGQGYVSQQQSVNLPAGTTVDVVFTVMAPTTTTTLPPTTTTVGPATTTTVASTTTTLGGDGSLQVTVRNAWNNSRIKNAWVNLEGRTAKTNSQGIVFFDDLQLRSYWINVTHNNYHDYNGTVTITGATTVTIYLTPD